MNSSNLARRLEDFETDIQTLRLSDEPVASRMVVQELLEKPRKPRRARVGGIRTGDQGLRSFRVR